MAKLKFDELSFKRFDGQVKDVAPAMEGMANQVVTVLATDLIGADFNANIGLNGIHRYTRADSYVFWQKIGVKYNNLVQDKPWLSKLFLTPVKEDNVKGISSGISHFLGGNALLVSMTAVGGSGAFGRGATNALNSTFLAPVMAAVHDTMQTLGIEFVTDAVIAGLVAVILVGAKMTWEAKKRYGSASFEKDRAAAIDAGALKAEKSFLERGKALFNSKYFSEPTVNAKTLNRIQTMLMMGFSTDKVMGFMKLKEAAAFRHINRSAATLESDYLVDAHASATLAMKMLLDIQGDTHHLTAILRSRHFPQGWAEKFKIDPQTIVKEHAAAPAQHYLENKASIRHQYLQLSFEG
jgi:hypothetical protein